MKKCFAYLMTSLCFLLHISMGNSYGQDTIASRVTGSFDSIKVKDIKAVGRISNGTVTMSMQVQNQYATPAQVHFRLGGEENFSLEDDRGTRYKIFTSEDMHGSADINKGFHNVTSFYFGGERSSTFMYARKELQPGEAKQLSIVIGSVNKAVRSFKEFRIRCKRSTGKKMDKETLYRIADIPVIWISDKTKPKK